MMPYSKHRVRLTLLALTSLVPALGLSACVTRTVYNRPAASCSTLIPPTLREKTPGAPLPLDGAQGSWVAFGDAQTAQKEVADLKKDASISIVESCEQRDREAEAATIKGKKLK